MARRGDCLGATQLDRCARDRATPAIHRLLGRLQPTRLIFFYGVGPLWFRLVCLWSHKAELRLERNTKRRAGRHREQRLANLVLIRLIDLARDKRPDEGDCLRFTDYSQVTFLNRAAPFEQWFGVAGDDRGAADVLLSQIKDLQCPCVTSDRCPR